MANKKQPRSVNVRFFIETECESDGRWIAEITDMPGVMAYGATEEEARANAYALALRVIADNVQDSKELPETITLARAIARATGLLKRRNTF
jgi:predicted RNase H-like HicB family nuclease